MKLSIELENSGISIKIGSLLNPVCSALNEQSDRLILITLIVDIEQLEW